MPRKEKIKLFEKILLIGYSKEEIVKSFGGGGTEEMELKGRHIPDCRDFNSLRYEEKYVIVGKK